LDPQKKKLFYKFGWSALKNAQYKDFLLNDLSFAKIWGDIIAGDLLKKENKPKKTECCSR